MTASKEIAMPADPTDGNIGTVLSAFSADHEDAQTQKETTMRRLHIAASILREHQVPKSRRVRRTLTIVKNIRNALYNCASPIDSDMRVDVLREIGTEEHDHALRVLRTILGQRERLIGILALISSGPITSDTMHACIVALGGDEATAHIALDPARKLCLMYEDDGYLTLTEDVDLVLANAVASYRQVLASMQQHIDEPRVIILPEAGSVDIRTDASESDAPSADTDVPVSAEEPVHDASEIVDAPVSLHEQNGSLPQDRIIFPVMQQHKPRVKAVQIPKKKRLGQTSNAQPLINVTTKTDASIVTLAFDPVRENPQMYAMLLTHFNGDADQAAEKLRGMFPRNPSPPPVNAQTPHTNGTKANFHTFPANGAKKNGTVHNQNGHDDVLSEHEPDAYKPTKACPGSEMKVIVLQSRYERQLPLWHPDDTIDHSTRAEKNKCLLNGITE